MDGSTHFGRFTPARALLAALLAVLLFGVLAAAAQAQGPDPDPVPVSLSGSGGPLPGSSFEGGDGNQVVNDPLNVDWATAVGVRHFAGSGAR